MKIAIIDDEIKEQDIIENYLLEWISGHGMQSDISRYDSSEHFLFHWEENKDFDLLILDIEMGQMNGMELARKIREENEDIPLMFITGYDEYMQYGYDVAALHYMIKPVNKDKFFMILDKLEKRQTVSSEEKIMLMTDKGARSVFCAGIIYVEANGHCCMVRIAGETILVKEAFGEVTKKLEPYTYFVKCHRAYLVNIRYVSMVLKAEILLDDKETIPVSRNQLKKVQSEFLRYYVNDSAV